MLILTGPRPLTTAAACFLAAPEETFSGSWRSLLVPSQQAAARSELAQGGLGDFRCPTCGAAATPLALRSLWPGGPMYGVGYSLDAEWHCASCDLFVAVSAAFSGWVLACAFAAADALAARHEAPVVPRDRWPDEQESTHDYGTRGPGWSGDETRRSWSLPGGLTCEVSMGLWSSQGGHDRGEDLGGTIRLPGGRESSLSCADRFRVAHRDEAWNAVEDEVTRAIDAVARPVRR
jgi:hypothetical protein